MPDAWEIAHGLNPYDPEDRNIVDAGGYTKLEEYLNELAGTPTSVLAERGAVPAAFGLSQNYPNPFNPATTVRYRLSARMHAVLEIFDILGKRIAVLDQGVRDAGEYSVAISADRWASGVYFCRLSAGNQGKSVKLLLMR
jgi:hypothetical protein